MERLDKLLERQVSTPPLEQYDFSPIFQVKNEKRDRLKTIDAVKPPVQIATEYLEKHLDIENEKTLHELEEVIGVSYSTVRRALLKLGRTPPKTKDR